MHVDHDRAVAVAAAELELVIPSSPARVCGPERDSRARPGVVLVAGEARIGKTIQLRPWSKADHSPWLSRLLNSS